MAFQAINTGKILELECSVALDAMNFINENEDSEDDPLIKPVKLYCDNLRLDHLELEWLNSCCLKRFPLEKMASECLTFLDLSHNSLTRLPFFLFQLPKLVVLRAAFNKIQLIENSVVEDGEIKSSNASVDVSRLDCPSLMSVDLSRNELTVVPGFLFSLPTLNNIDLSFNAIPNLSLEKLKSVNTRKYPTNTQVSEVPVIYGSRWQNRVTIGQFDFDSEDFNKSHSNLCDLNFSHNLFKFFPMGLACLAPLLKRLDLSHNKLEELGSVSDFPVGLEWLDVSYNNIALTDDPVLRNDSRAINCFSPFRTSSGETNQARCIHRQHVKLERLKTLRLNNNKISRLVFPKCPKQLDRVSDLHTHPDIQRKPSCNSLKRMLSVEDGHLQMTIPFEFIYPAITDLCISHNPITELPRELCRMTNLVQLDISHTQVSMLHPEFGTWQSMWNLNMEGCPVLKSLELKLGQSVSSTKVVIKHLQSISEELVPYLHMKLMFVGVQGIGKTSLLRKICNKDIKHWNQRRAEDSKSTTVSGSNLSTVGVDIGTFQIGKGVSLSTWDFGGQAEYYDTHQFFLSNRSLYLLVWRVTDGKRGIDELQTWLDSIQTRAPNSAVIIVGTHRDQADPKFIEEMGELIEEKYIRVCDREKKGLPRVVGHIVVSNIISNWTIFGKSFIPELRNLIMEAILKERVPGSMEPFMEQKVPMCYVRLQDTIRFLAKQLQDDGRPPFFYASEYLKVVTQTMKEKYECDMFTDMAHLMKATEFLHDSGVLLHFHEGNLRDIFFLDPQWICDVLATVVTSEVNNNSIKQGFMRKEALKLLFKTQWRGCKGLENIIVDLLGRFEVALQVDDDNLLFPSLLPKGVTDNYAAVLPVTDLSRNNEQSLTVGLKNLSNLGSFKIRLYTMSYFPTGIFHRLVARVLSDKSFESLLLSFYDFTSANVEKLQFENPEDSPSWHCWDNGLRFAISDATLFQMRMISPTSSEGLFDYKRHNLVIKEGEDWTALKISESCILEIVIPSETIALDLKTPTNKKERHRLHPSDQVVSAFLAKLVVCIDTLLEDWYPSIGIPFEEDRHGNFLVQRLVPCIQCLYNRCSSRCHAYNGDDLICDLGSVFENPPSAVPYFEESGNGDLKGVAFCFTLEQCIVEAQARMNIACPKHGSLGPMNISKETGVHLAHAAPDTIFLDLGHEKRFDASAISMERMLGRGGFGSVYAATFINKNGVARNVAVKMMTPVGPTECAPPLEMDENKTLQALLEKENMKNCCNAYSNVRKELTIMNGLRHPNIVELVGICLNPLSLILDLAPQGVLTSHLADYRREGARLPVLVIRDIVLQIGSALAHLHSQKIIYRDLKAENVLVWSLPAPHEDSRSVVIDVRLADYGVSRSVPSTEVKGMAGTLPFMAPEIIIYGGDRTYTNKADCYSFAVFMYELLTLKQPYHDGSFLNGPQGSLKKHILDGARPNLCTKDTMVPTNMLDLMTLCWSLDPNDRPSMQEICNFAQKPEFTDLWRAVVLGQHERRVVSACSVGKIDGAGESENRQLCDVWCAIKTDATEKDGSANLTGSLLVFTYDQKQCILSRKVLPDNLPPPTCMCVTETDVWYCGSNGTIHIISKSDYHRVVFTLKSILAKDKIMADVNVKDIIFNESVGKVCLVLDDDRVLVLDLTDKHSKKLGQEEKGEEQMKRDRNEREKEEKRYGKGGGNHAIKNQKGGKWEELEKTEERMLRVLYIIHPEQSIHCATMLLMSDDTSGSNSSYSLWFGHAEFSFSVWKLKQDSVAIEERTYRHPVAVEDPMLITSILVSDPPCVWTTVQPGSKLFKWDVQSMTVRDIVDLSGHLSCTSKNHVCQDNRYCRSVPHISCMKVIDQNLFVGTMYGQILVVDTRTLACVVSCRPHIAEVVTFLDLGSPSQMNKTAVCPIASVGRGYRDLARQVLGNYKDQVPHTERMTLISWTGEWS